MISPAAVIAGILVILALALSAIARTRHGTLLHPCLILGGILCAVGLLGSLVYPLVWENGPTPLRVSAGTEEVNTLNTFLLFGLAPLAVAAFAPPARVTSPGLRIDIGKQPPIVRRGVIFFLFIVAIAFLIGANLAALFYRDTYQGFAGTTIPEAFRIGNGLLLPAILVAWAFVLSPQASRRERLVAWSALLVFTLMEIATASRGLGLVPLLFLLAYGLTQGRMPSIRLVVATGLISLICLAAGLFLRTSTEHHGLLPYTQAMVTQPQDVFTSQIPRVAANLLAGFPLATHIIVKGTDIDADALWTSLNPLPRRGLGYDPDVEHRVTDYMPYSAVGMLGRMGIGIGIAYFLIVGLALAALWNRGHTTIRRATIARPVLVGMAVSIGLLALQYQLRTTTRLTTMALVGLPLLLAFLGGRATERREGRQVAIGRKLWLNRARPAKMQAIPAVHMNAPTPYLDALIAYAARDVTPASPTRGRDPELPASGA